MPPTLRQYILDANDEPVRANDFVQWATWMDEHRGIAHDALSGLPIRVSTVFLGVDSTDGDPPILFESMVFIDGDDAYTRRYATKAEALAGHAELVAKMREQAALSRSTTE